MKLPILKAEKASGTLQSFIRNFLEIRIIKTSRIKGDWQDSELIPLNYLIIYNFCWIS
jgi:hypothetical protein